MNAGFVLAVEALLALASPAGAASDRLSFDGLGPARIGMTRPALEAALGGPLSKDEATEDATSCEIIFPRHGYDGISYMLLNGRVARIDIDTHQVITVSGIGLDATEASVMATYPGRVSVEPHAYIGPGGKYLTLLSTDGRRGIRFETDGGNVSRFYAGTTEAIQLIEGCQ